MIDARTARAIECASPDQIVKLLSDVQQYDPVEVETRARALRLMAEHGPNEIKFECRICDDGSVEWWVWFYFSGMSCLRSGATLCEAVARLIPDMAQARRRGEIFARTEKLLREADAAEKALASQDTIYPFSEVDGAMPEGGGR